MLRFARNDDETASYSITLALISASGTKHSSYFPKIRYRLRATRLYTASRSGFGTARNTRTQPHPGKFDSTVSAASDLKNASPPWITALVSGSSGLIPNACASRVP